VRRNQRGEMEEKVILLDHRRQKSTESLFHTKKLTVEV
jgi:hypothetical protein